MNFRFKVKPNHLYVGIVFFLSPVYSVNALHLPFQGQAQGQERKLALFQLEKEETGGFEKENKKIDGQEQQKLWMALKEQAKQEIGLLGIDDHWCQFELVEECKEETGPLLQLCLSKEGTLKIFNINEDFAKYGLPLLEEIAEKNTINSKD